MGVLEYATPEILDHKAYTKVVDIYSVGMIAFEMVSREIPFASQDINPLSLALKIVKGDRPDFPNYTPQFWRDMVESCWHSDPLC
jgi:serine/threonine protein kinase